MGSVLERLIRRPVAKVAPFSHEALHCILVLDLQPDILQPGPPNLTGVPRSFVERGLATSRKGAEGVCLEIRDKYKLLGSSGQSSN